MCEIYNFEDILHERVRFVRAWFIYICKLKVRVFHWNTLTDWKNAQKVTKFLSFLSVKTRPLRKDTTTLLSGHKRPYVMGQSFITELMIFINININYSYSSLLNGKTFQPKQDLHFQFINKMVSYNRNNCIEFDWTIFLIFTVAFKSLHVSGYTY